MKRLSIILIALAGAMAFAGCQKQDVQEPASTYYFEVGGNALNLETKNYYLDNMTFEWSEGDQISVLFHKGTDDKFFTLTATSIDGASAVFGGNITSGYTIGASDTGIKWALFPAGTHVYNGADYPADADEDNKNPITFNVPRTTDFTQSHFSVNIPMAAKLDAGVDAGFSFTPAAACIKFSFKGISKSKKVKLTIESQYTHRISGDFPMREGGYCLYWYNQYGSLGSEGCKISYIASVKNKKAEFYIPWAPWDYKFQPIVTLTDADTDGILYSATASKFFASSSDDDLCPVLTHMIVVPEITASGSATWSFPSAYGIDWANISNEVAGDAEEGFDAIVCMKGTADADNLYIYLEVQKDALISDPSYGHSSHNYFYFGNGTGETTYWPWEAPYLDRFQGWLQYQNAPRYISYDISGYSQKAVEHDGLYIYEIAFSRSSSSFTALGGSSVTVCMNIDGIYTDSAGGWLGTWDATAFAPARWTDALTVDLP